MNDKERVLNRLEKYCKDLLSGLGSVNIKFKNDKEMFLAAIKKDRGFFKYASDKLKNDREFVLDLVGVDGGVLEFASDELKNDREIVLKAV